MESKGIQYIDGDVSLDLLDQNFRGVVALNHRRVASVGLKGSFSDKDKFKEYLPDARWYSVEKAWMVELTSENQRSVFKAVQLAREEMNLTDVAFEGRLNELGKGIINNFKILGIVKPKEDNAENPKFL